MAIPTHVKIGNNALTKAIITIIKAIIKIIKAFQSLGEH
jgi:hypothetical protein